MHVVVYRWVGCGAHVCNISTRDRPKVGYGMGFGSGLGVLRGARCSSQSLGSTAEAISGDRPGSREMDFGYTCTSALALVPVLALALALTLALAFALQSSRLGHSRCSRPPEWGVAPHLVIHRCPATGRLVSFLLHCCSTSSTLNHSSGSALSAFALASS